METRKYTDTVSLVEATTGIRMYGQHKHSWRKQNILKYNLKFIKQNHDTILL